MKINYPNRSDKIRGDKKDPGGLIFIHGDCVTIGCVPLTDRWIEELYLICLDPHWRYGKPTLVHIFPTRLDEKGMQWLEKKYADSPGLLAFWKELQPGYEYFEKSHIPARFSINKQGAYRFQPQK
jgi:murein L,D-transpeptidase YafK